MIGFVTREEHNIENDSALLKQLRLSHRHGDSVYAFASHYVKPPHEPTRASNTVIYVNGYRLA